MKKELLTFASVVICAASSLYAQNGIDVHDPVVARGEDGKYYMFATGMGVSVKSSTDLKDWQREKPVLPAAPAWAIDSVPGYRGHTWAPDIINHNGLWHLYYSCSTFGKNGSAIGHAVNKTLDPTSPDFGWTDMGNVIVSHRNADHYNAIDPNLCIDKDGRTWLTFGSFWDGIQLVELSSDDLQTPVSKPVTIARRRAPQSPQMAEYHEEEGVEAGDNAIEAPFIYHHGDWYYLFVSHDYCCRGENSTYKTVYGRSKDIQGPYVDKEGRRMDEGGGVYLFGPDADNFGIGHCSVYDFDGVPTFFAHAYVKADNGAPHLFTRQLSISPDGWISLP